MQVPYVRNLPTRHACVWRTHTNALRLCVLNHANQTPSVRFRKLPTQPKHTENICSRVSNGWLNRCGAVFSVWMFFCEPAGSPERGPALEGCYPVQLPSVAISQCSRRSSPPRSSHGGLSQSGRWALFSGAAACVKPLGSGCPPWNQRPHYCLRNPVIQ